MDKPNLQCSICGNSDLTYTMVGENYNVTCLCCNSTSQICFNNAMDINFMLTPIKLKDTEHGTYYIIYYDDTFSHKHKINYHKLNITPKHVIFFEFSGAINNIQDKLLNKIGISNEDIQSEEYLKCFIIRICLT